MSDKEQATEALHRMTGWKVVDAAAVNDSIPYSQLRYVTSLAGGGVLMIFYDGNTWFGLACLANAEKKVVMLTAEVPNA